MNDRAKKPSGGEAEKSGREKREHFRVNAEIRVSVVPLEEGQSKPWAYSENGGISPIIAPSEEDLAYAKERICCQSARKVNLSAGGLRTGYAVEDPSDPPPEVEAGAAVSVVLELRVASGEDDEVTLVHLPAHVVWVESTMKWTHMAVQFGRMPTGVERVLTHFVREMERRRLRPS